MILNNEMTCSVPKQDYQIIYYFENKENDGKQKINYVEVIFVREGS